MGVTQIQDNLTTLLPAARVDFFLLDAGTVETVKNLSSDWRFARVGLETVMAGIDAAIKHYAQNASPEMIVIETNDISDAFIAQLGQLAGVCAEGTDAVIIGPTNDVHLYRNLIGMGVRDYLVRPVSNDEFVGVIARSLIEKRGLAGSRLVSVIGSKGGVGTTAVAQNIAWIIAEQIGVKTVLLDAAGGAGSLGISYGIEPGASFTEAVRIGASGSEDDLKRLVQPVTDHLSLLVCSGDPLQAEAPDVDAVEGLVDRLMQKNPVVVIDLSGAPAYVQKRMLAKSVHVIAVTTPLLSALRNTRSLLNDIKNIRTGARETDLIVNMQGVAGGEEVPMADIKKALDREPSMKISFAPKVFITAEASGKPVGRQPHAQAMLKDLLPVASRAAGQQAAAPQAAESGGGLQALLKNVIKKKSG